MDCNRPGSSVHGVPQARMLEWVAMPCSISQDVSVLIPSTCECIMLHDQRGFGGVIKDMDSEMESYPGESKWARSSYTNTWNWETFPDKSERCCARRSRKDLNNDCKSESVSRSSGIWRFVTLWTVASQASLFRQECGVGCHSLLQGIFQIQGSSPGLLHRR